MDLADRLALDPDGPPPFEQVRSGIIDLIRRGDLLVGQRIPTVRRPAADLDLAPNTVAKSYRELESAGIIETRGRHGSFIKAGGDTARDRAQQATVDHVAALRQLGIDDDMIVAMVRQVIQG
ncbi:GntR family transcriptional regulator [Gordonia sp. HNM0687]|uniref:GntR family transcriptional regulator n=1 Tax=Gordonia mangrovi TaxID=2665643 RepID=A0A6L7GSA8_9ACTN|nr:GntR family transcriptional regulator [Gordonia mangrovi]MXP22879.1 GntR family transcriptional regulator [Gordonia mangrovi]UVF77186.1 GntR family transcriptional regulator [Gordonia mangrovi]